MDMVAHCGKSVAGSHVHSLVLTDMASGWTEAIALVVILDLSRPFGPGNFLGIEKANAETPSGSD